MEETVVILSTCPPEDAERLGEKVVTEKLAACVNCIPGLVSIYHWEGKLERSAESLLVMKTRSDRVQDLVAGLKAAHPYTVPEIVVLPITGGNPDYLRWVADSVPGR